MTVSSSANQVPIYLPLKGLPGNYGKILTSLGFELGPTGLLKPEGDTRTAPCLQVDAIPDGWTERNLGGGCRCSSAILDAIGNVRIHYYTKGIFGIRTETEIATRFSISHILSFSGLGFTSLYLNDKELRKYVPEALIYQSPPTQVPETVIELKNEKLWVKVPHPIRGQITGTIKRECETIIRKHLPKMDDPLSYWGENCSGAISAIAQEFSELGSKFKKRDMSYVPALLNVLMIMP